MPKLKTKKPARRRSREELMEAIIAAATEIFAARENATIRSIAARAGVQPSVVIRYFGTKQALLGEIAARGARRDAEIFAEYMRDPPALLGTTLRENPAYRAALLRGVLGGLRPTDVPGGLASVEQAAQELMRHRFEPVHPDARYDPRLVVAFLAAATVGWQVTGEFFSTAAGLGHVDAEDVQAEVAYLLSQIYGLAEPDLRMEER